VVLSSAQRPWQTRTRETTYTSTIATLEDVTHNLEAAPKSCDLAGFGGRSLFTLPPLTPPDDAPFPNSRSSAWLPSLDTSAGQQGRYWPGLNTNVSQSGQAASHTLPTPPSADNLDLKPPRLSRQGYSNMATVAVPSMGMPTSLDALNAPSSLTARRQATANLPNFELPPPSNLQFANNSNQRFHQLPNLNGMQSSSASVSVGNLLTPPSNSASDSVSSVSSSMNNSSNTPTNQGILTYTPTWWAAGSTPSGFHTGYTPPQPWSGHNSLLPPRSMFSPPSQPFLRNTNNSPTVSESQSLPPPPYDLNSLNSLPPFQSHLSMSGSPNLPTTSQQQQNVIHALMNPPHSMPGPTQLSPVDTGDGSNQKLPPTPTMYGGPQSSSTPQQATFSYPGPSPVQQSPHSASAPESRASLPVSQPSGGHDHAHSPFIRPPYPSYSLPPMPGPVMTNVNNPHGQPTMVSSMQQGMIPPEYNSSYVANNQSLYGSQQPQAGQPSTVERPFKCDQCPQSFNRNHDLKRHKRIHLAVKPFPCNHCDKSFSRKDALKVSRSKPQKTPLIYTPH
jgi:Zinc finger, C2H2 type